MVEDENSIDANHGDNTDNDAGARADVCGGGGDDSATDLQQIGGIEFESYSSPSVSRHHGNSSLSLQHFQWIAIPWSCEIKKRESVFTHLLLYSFETMIFKLVLILVLTCLIAGIFKWNSNGCLLSTPNQRDDESVDSIFYKRRVYTLYSFYESIK